MPTWTSTDLDSASSEDGVVHESVANTDHDNASVVKQGYSVASPYLSTDLVSYWPLHEDSGSTANDFSGNGNHGTINGATVGVTGILGSTCYSFDGTDDYIGLPSFGNLFDGSNPWTLVYWINPDTAPSGRVVQLSPRADYDVWTGIQSGVYEVGFFDGSVNQADGNSVTTGEWVQIAAVWDPTGSFHLFENAVETASVTTASPNSLSGTQAFGGDPGGINGFTAADMGEVSLYDSALSASEIQAHYDVVTTRGQLITTAKTI